MVMVGLMLKSLKIGNKFSKNIKFECEFSGKILKIFHKFVE